MKVILKIDRYLPDTNYVAVKITKLHSNTSIDEMGAKMIDCSDLNMTNTEMFIESIANKISHMIDRQESSIPILEENQPIEVEGDLDFDKLIGKVLQTRISNSCRTIKMRRIEL